MKYYKTENNKFIGFYDSEIHDLFINGKLKENYFELSEEKWTELLNGQSEGKEIKILKNGELGLFEKPQPPQEFYRPIWDETEEEWKEGATEEALMEERANLIIELREIRKKISDLEEEGKLDPELASPKTVKKYKEQYKEVRNKIIELKKVIENL